jgi:SAM-dependent methyltransferase
MKAGPAPISPYIDAVASLGARNVPPGGETALSRVLARIEPSPKFILDIGCNTGWVTVQLARFFPRSRVVGIDIDPGMTAAARVRVTKERLGRRVSFVEMDCMQLSRKFRDVDLAVSAGSTAFVQDRGKLLEELSKSLSPSGKFVDMNYVYEKSLGPREKQAEREMFGLSHGGETLSELLNACRYPELSLTHFDDLGAYTLPEVDDDWLQFLLGIESPAIQVAVQRMLRGREMARELSKKRNAAVFTYSRLSRSGEQTPSRRTTAEELSKCMKVLDLFHTAVPRLPIEQIERLNPYEFLAYIGDPDAAPGGSASVSEVAGRLRDLGLGAESRVLDVGSFTGLSTIVLGASFPNVIGIDIDGESLRIAKAIGKGFASPAKFMRRDGRDTGFRSGRFDAVVLTATLGYTEDPNGIVQESRRLLRSGGYFVEFLYDYPDTSREFEDFLRRTVSPFIKVQPLANQIATIESHRFRCHKVQAVAASDLPAATLKRMQLLLVHRESQENPHLSPSQLRRFSQLVEDYVTGTPPGTTPISYLCIFEAC